MRDHAFILEKLVDHEHESRCNKKAAINKEFEEVIIVSYTVM